MDWCVSPAGTSPLPGPSQFSLTCLWGVGDCSPAPHIHPCPEIPPSPLPNWRQRKGRVDGGAGLPLGTAVAQSISPKPRNFLLPKRKKEKKNPSGHLSSLPHWDSRDWICGVSREGGSGLEHSQARVVELPSGPPPGPLWASSLSSLLPLQANHQRWPSPDLRPLGWRPGWRGRGRGCCAALQWVGLGAAPGLPRLEGRHKAPPPSTLYPLPLLPRAGHFLPQAAVGTCVPSSKSVPSSPTPPG